jgi:hypothetical protein
MSRHPGSGGRADAAVEATDGGRGAPPPPAVAPGKRTRVQSARGARLAVAPGTLSMNARVGGGQTQAVTLTNRSREAVEIVDVMPQARPTVFVSAQIDSTRQGIVGGHYHCSQLTRFRKYRFTAKAGLTVSGELAVNVRASRDGIGLEVPAYLTVAGTSERRTFLAPWSSHEPAPLPAFPAWPN